MEALSSELSRRERKKIEAKEKIKNAALKLFLDKGFAATTIAEIMEEADLGTGTFYNHFTSKEEIINCIVMERILNAQDEIRWIAHGEVAASVKLKQVVAIIGKAFEENKALIKLLFQQLRSTHPTAKPVTHGNIFSDMLLKIIEEGQKNGEFMDNIPSRIIQELIHGILQSTVFSSDNSINISRNLDFKINILFNGIMRRE